MSKTEKVIIFGIGYFGEVAHFYLTNDSHYEVAAFTVDKEHIKDGNFCGLPVVPFDDVEARYPPESFKMFVAIAYRDVNKSRAKKYNEAKEKGYELISYVCSKSITWSDLDIGDNCFVFENQTIQPFVKIGNDVVIWSGNHIGHHSKIGDHCFITSHVVISGNCSIGKNCFIGVNATLKDGITIADGCVIGSATNVVKDTQAGGVYIGNPAKLYAEDSSKIDL